MSYTKITPELEKKIIKQYQKSDKAHTNFKLLGISSKLYYFILKKNKVFKENNPLDMVGKKFNRVIVLKYLPKQTKIKHERMYRCLCDCGKKFNTRGLPLVYGTTKSCGCWFKEFAGQHTVTHGLTRVGHISPIATMFINAKSRAKKRGIPFTIVISDITLPKYCPVFPWIKIKRGLTGPIHTSPSLDRLIPELGYVPGNVFVISHKANTVKSFGTLKEHLAVAEYIKKNSKNNVPS